MTTEKKMDDLPLGRRIRYWRELRGLSQRALGEKIGRYASAICDWEAGRSAPDSKDVLPALVSALGLDMQAFYARIDDEQAA